MMPSQPDLSSFCAKMMSAWMLIFAEFMAVLSNGIIMPRSKSDVKSNYPRFDRGPITNISVQLGAHAFLPCKIRPMGDNSVSWVRLHDAHILTVNHYVYVSDARFQPSFIDATNTWTLQIKFVQARDAGIYECQICSTPKTSQYYQLNVIVPHTIIEGELERHVKAGSTVTLTCVISRSLDEPAYIFWYQDTVRVLNQDKHQLAISMERIKPDTTIGKLTIYNARRLDSGNYSCVPSNLDSASVVLHVLNGEEPAAMQHENAGWRIAGRRKFMSPMTLAAITFLYCASKI